MEYDSSPSPPPSLPPSPPPSLPPSPPPFNSPSLSLDEISTYDDLFDTQKPIMKELFKITDILRNSIRQNNRLPNYNELDARTRLRRFITSHNKSDGKRFHPKTGHGNAFVMYHAIISANQFYINDSEFLLNYIRKEIKDKIQFIEEKKNSKYKETELTKLRRYTAVMEFNEKKYPRLVFDHNLDLTSV